MNEKKSNKNYEQEKIKGTLNNCSFIIEDLFKMIG